MFYWFRIISLMFLDAALIAAGLFLSLWLRFDQGIPDEYYQSLMKLLPMFLVVLVACLYFSRLYHRLWKYASIGELLGIIKAIAIGTLICVAAIYGLGLPTLPRRTYITSVVLIVAFVGLSRMGWRVFRDQVIKAARESLKNVLIIGAGDAGAIVARELISNPALGLEPIGFVDDNHLKQKMSIFGIEVLGRRRDIPRLVAQYAVEEIIIAMPSASGRTIRELLAICRTTSASVRIFQGTGELLTNNELRHVEMDDLLRREPVSLELDNISAYLSGRRVMVSGAGGSIGSELCRQIAQFQPEELIILDNSENSLFDIEQELKRRWGDLRIAVELADIKDLGELVPVFKKHTPQVVFHAAAYKHVPMMELHPDQAFRNNIIGTRNMTRLAREWGTEVFILVSTDKAVNPSSVMGASKRLAEMIVQNANGHKPGTRFAAVRFGNVLGSKGSVVPIFKQQIDRGGPVTVTHPEMTRYFMTIPEACGLIMQAGALAGGGEIFVLDMGEPVKIMDLAEDLIRLAGKEPGKDIEIGFIGLRPGEKLHEELFYSDEECALTRHKKIFMVNSSHEGLLNSDDLQAAWETMLGRLPKLSNLS